MRELSGRGFASAAAGGFVTGALGMTPAAGLAGAAFMGAIGAGMDDEDDS